MRLGEPDKKDKKSLTRECVIFTIFTNYNICVMNFCHGWLKLGRPMIIITPTLTGVSERGLIIP